MKISYISLIIRTINPTRGSEDIASGESNTSPRVQLQRKIMVFMLYNKLEISESVFQKRNRKNERSGKKNERNSRND